MNCSVSPDHSSPSAKGLGEGTWQDSSSGVAQHFIPIPADIMGTDWVGQSQHTLFPALAHRVGIFWDEWHCQDTAWVSPSQCFNLLQSSKLPSDARIVHCICTSFSQGPMVASPSSILCQMDKGR